MQPSLLTLLPVFLNLSPLVNQEQPRTWNVPSSLPSYTASRHILFGLQPTGSASLSPSLCRYRKIARRQVLQNGCAHPPALSIQLLGLRTTSQTADDVPRRPSFRALSRFFTNVLASSLSYLCKRFATAWRGFGTWNGFRCRRPPRRRSTRRRSSRSGHPAARQSA